MSPELTCRHINAALDSIDTAPSQLRVNCCATYASGYIRALQDEQVISCDGAQYYREDVVARRKKRLTELDLVAPE